MARRANTAICHRYSKRKRREFIMAHITLNTNTTTSPTALALPDNARIVIIDTDTNTETADLVISGAESLIVFDGDVQITTTASADAEKTVADEKACTGSA